MKQRGHESDCERIPWGRLLAVAWGVGAVASALVTTTTGDGLAMAASLLFLGDVREKRGLTWLVGWLVGGSLLGAGLGYAAALLISGFPLATQGAVGLGIALGGGVGVVSNLLAAEAQGDDVDQTESMTVDMETDDSPSPRPADLFDDHPDPVLYVADRGHGPVVLAANDAFAETFDVPADALGETPLAESLMADDESDTAVETVVDAVASGDPVDETLACRTPSGTVQFRLRTAGGGADGYVIYTRTGHEE